MRRALAAGLFSMAIVACGGKNDSHLTPVPFTPVEGGSKEWFQEAYTAMQNLESYHVVISFPPAPEENRLEVDFVKPDRYRFLLFSAQGETKEACPDLPERSVYVGECPQIYTEITQRDLYETVVVDGAAYGRRCDDVDTNCGAWETVDAPPVPVAGPSPTYQPLWPIVALQFAAPVTVEGAQEVEGETIVYVEGTVNQIRAVLENQRRLGEAAGVTSYGTTCSAAETPIVVGETPAASAPAAVEDCHEQTFDEMLADQEPGLSFYDQHPALIAIQVLPDSHRVRRMSIAGEADSEDSTGFTVLIEYSAYDSVTVEAPE